MEQSEPILIATEGWRVAYPGAALGVLVMGNVASPGSSPQLDARKQALEAELRNQFASLTRSDLKQHPLLEPYTRYYKRFGKTYHVQHQLETIVFKGMSIPRIAALVEAMFMAELKNLLLTAGHDRDAVRGTLELDVATGSETYPTLTGQAQTLKQGDMFISDEVGILSSILHGPDRRTRIGSGTTRVLFTVYAPEGVQEERLRVHLDDLADYVHTIAPDAGVEHLHVIQA